MERHVRHIAFHSDIATRPNLDPWTAEALERLGGAVRGARLSSGLSQKQLERRSGVDQVSISRLERGVAPHMAIVRLARIAAALPHSRLCGYSADGELPVAYRIGSALPTPYSSSRIQGEGRYQDPPAVVSPTGRDREHDRDGEGDGDSDGDSGQPSETA